jgi:predicted component of type VI protein secretion system
VKRFLKWYLWLVLSRPIIRAIDWTAEERNAFDLFCRTSCGIKLFEYLRQLVAASTFNAVYRNSVSANFEARGAQNLLAVLHRLRVFPAIQEESSETGLSDSEPPVANTGAKRVKADEWRWLGGGRGAIG